LRYPLYRASYLFCGEEGVRRCACDTIHLTDIELVQGFLSFVVSYRGTSLIGNTHPPRITIASQAQVY